MSLSESSLANFQKFLVDSSGISISKEKKYLLESRLKPLAKLHDIENLDQLVEMVCRNQKSAFAYEVVDSMTTNETLFFRDKYPFGVLREIIFPELMRLPSASNRTIKIWSAAASRGQEPYSIAMTALEKIPGADKKIKILATDLSPSAIAYAKQGIYTQMEVQRGMPVQQLVKYFSQLEDETWQVKDVLHGMLNFNTANLVSPNLILTVRHYSEFDIVFCRNVLIYFNIEERRRVIDRIAKVMRPGGYLFVGSSERVEGEHSKWEVSYHEKRPYWKMLSSR